MTAAAHPFAIDLRDVMKVYRKNVHALQGVSMQVHRGEVFGLLGPNGAGKSTLVKIMMTVVRPTRADGSLLGNPIGHKATLARVGYLPENHRFPKYLTGRQVLEFFAALAKVNRPARRRRATELLETVGMSQWGNTKIGTYSKGMLQRVGLAQALVNDPDLIVLDEPTDGVDPVGRREILEVLGRLRGQGKTVFVNSHALSELESICDRVAILVHGQVARQGTIDQLTIAQQRYEIEVAADSSPDFRQSLLAALPVQWKVKSTEGNLQRPVMARSPSQQPPALGYAAPIPVAPPLPRMADIGELSDGTAIEIEGPIIRIATTDAAAVQGLIDTLRQANIVIRRVQQMRPSLEDLFFDAVTDPETGRAALPGAARAPASARTGGRS